MAFNPYQRPEGGSNSNSASRNPRYKGKNYDPNYQEKLRSQQNNNQTLQEYLTQQGGANNNSSQENPFASTSNPLMSSFYKQQQPNVPNAQTQQSHHQQAQQAQQQQQQQAQQQLEQQQLEQLRQQYQQKRQQGQLQFQSATPSLDLPMQFLAQFSQQVGRKLAKDFEGDHRICECNNPGGTECFHAISALYQNQLVLSGQIQYDIVDLLRFLISKDETAQQSIRIGLSEYLQKKPQTPLRKILQTMGREGLVKVGVGASSGPGVGVVTDNTLNTDGSIR